MRFNFWNHWNIKSDRFTGSTDTGRVLNWEPLYHVNADGNVCWYGDQYGEEIGEGEGVAGEYWPPNSVQNAYAHAPDGVPTLINDQTNRNGIGAGPGGGDYHLTGLNNTGYNRVPAGRAMLSYDLDGNARRNDGSGAAGVYERRDATGAAVTGPSSGRVGSPTLHITVSLNGFPTGNVTFTPHLTGVTGTFSANGLSFAGQTQAASLTLLPSSAGSATITWTNNGNLANPAPLVIAIVHQTYSFTGPTGGSQSALIGPFTLTVAGTLLSLVTVTPSDGGNEGQFIVNGSPASTLTLPAATNPSVLFSYFPTAHGAISLTVPNNGGLPAPAAIELTVTEEGPILAPVTVPVERLAVLQMVPTAPTSSIALISALPAVWAAPLDPSDNALFAVDFSAVLAGEAIDSIVSVSINAEAAALGIAIDNGIRRPLIDRAHNKIGIWIKGDPLQRSNAAFSGGGIWAGLTIKLTTQSDPAATYERTVALHVRQL